MSYVATLTRTGQITIPKGVRELLGVKPGQRVTFQRKKNEVVIMREKTAAEIAEEIDKLIPGDVREKHMKEYAGLTSAELQEKWLKNEDAAKHFREEMERIL